MLVLYLLIVIYNKQQCYKIAFLSKYNTRTKMSTLHTLSFQRKHYYFYFFSPLIHYIIKL